MDPSPLIPGAVLEGSTEPRLAALMVADALFF